MCVERRGCRRDNWLVPSCLAQISDGTLWNTPAGAKCRRNSRSVSTILFPLKIIVMMALFFFFSFKKKKKRRRNSECNNLWNVQLVPVSFRCAAALSTLALTRIMASLHLIALSNKCYSLLLPFKFNWINSVKSRIWGGGDSARPRPSNKVIKAQFFFSETIRFN